MSTYRLRTLNYFQGAPRIFGKSGKEHNYQKGNILDVEENREVELKGFTGEKTNRLPWKIMEKAKRFICGCLNADKKGIIYFGIGDCQEQASKFLRGEVLGLDVESIIDDIMKAFQAVLDDHIRSDDGPMQKGGDQNCINIEFVPVVDEAMEATGLHIIEIEVSRDWKFCKENLYYSKVWKDKRTPSGTQENSPKKRLSDFFKVLDEWEGIVIRTSGSTVNVPQHEGNKQVKEPLVKKYKAWKRNWKHGNICLKCLVLHSVKNFPMFLFSVCCKL